MNGPHIHLIGVCGTAMASLAGMLKERGIRVSGSDAAAYPPMSDFLAKIGVSVAQPFAEANLDPRPDLVVVGNAISRGNVELEYVLDRRIPFTSMAELLHREFLHDREVIAIAGTHGKTTTTSMLSWIFHHAGRNPSFLIGGIAENFGSSFAVADGAEFIIEGDEYDTAFFDKGPKFLHYFPKSLILTAVEFDHADIYKDLDEVKTAFKRLVNLVPRSGCILAWDGHPNVDECVTKAFCKVERYGFTARADWRIVDVEHAPEKTSWRVLRNGEPWAHFEFPIAGDYNVLNATAAAAMAAHYAIDTDAIAEALHHFKSVKRRLEVKAEVKGITIIDDFAHHPTAIAETLKALRSRYAGRRLWAVLEPRSNTLRRNVFQHELVQSLRIADRVVLAATFKSEAIPEKERLDPANVVAELNQLGTPAELHASADKIVAAIAPQLAAGDVVGILSNGGFGGIYEKLPARIEAGA
ncbi:UDP-N-acetylmuramate--L-alanine ligase [Candidatus Koribacter versatilis Ellin345]|uniref:UDP-N-acetylmuramate--L-alanine ligase n=1 Tax=Koribacter versatilis (strain Ellin345) TaxID=204669 RepID=Q1INC9_KORVE|nr:UDP-N-acetylmuramate:L-alanyl-gamma-D-glutamyl-meso-diaminopimelate ligase [Candidatus Koribacter versatilis]ABF41621.1 UDP-N-acetylmuramate--L-alanine ligase [Candidatus Koribacter versatilis Ellin345]